MKTNLKTETFICSSCSKKIERNLSRQADVEVAKVLFNSSKFKVQHDEHKIIPDEVKDIVEMLGYRVHDVTSI